MQFVCIFLVVFGYIYEDADSLVVDNDSLTICGQHQYNIKVDIRHNSQLQVRQWSGAADSFGILVLQAPEINIGNSSSIIGTGSGPFGGYLNSHPAGYGTGGGGAGHVNGGAGGGGAYGGDGGQGGDFYGGPGGSTYGDPTDTIIEYGSGGGAGRLSVVDGHGGNGGAKVYLTGNQINIDYSILEVYGQDGFDASVEAGGGGSGGGIMVYGGIIHIYSSALHADGGDGGDASFGGGGGGGGGRIKIFYTSLLDTSLLTISVEGGDQGTGTYGSPTPGSTGSWLIGYLTDIAEYEKEQSFAFTIKPNPVKNYAVLYCLKTPTHLCVYDAAGHEVKHIEVLTKTAVINFNELNPGVYFLASSKNTNTIQKIVIMR